MNTKELRGYFQNKAKRNQTGLQRDRDRQIRIYIYIYIFRERDTKKDKANISQDEQILTLKTHFMYILEKSDNKLRLHEIEREKKNKIKKNKMKNQVDKRLEK